MNSSAVPSQLKSSQQWGLIILRIIIGWHFLYEGIVKLLDTGWSAEGYLANSNGPLAGIFHFIASNGMVMDLVNMMNIWGLILIGAALFLGVFGRLAVYAGILLLSFYYLAYPPFQGYNFGVPQEGRYLLVDKTFVELIALVVLALFPTTLNTGLWSLLNKLKSRIPDIRKKQKAQPFEVESTDDKQPVSESRRAMLKQLTFLPFLGGFTWAFMSNKSYTGADAFSGSTFTLDQKSLSDLEGKMPMGVLVKGKAPISRLILGHNILSGTAHARDLVYARSLFRAYNTEKKIIETYMLAEKAGINLFFLSPLLNQYKKIYGGKFQTWINVDPRKGDLTTQVDKAIDQGVDYIFIMGAAVDQMVREKNFDLIAGSIDYIKSKKYPAGLGAHSVEAFIACDEAGIEPDFYYKTMHHDKYWSAHPRENRIPLMWKNFSQNHDEFNDNMWCLFPEKTIEYVRNARKPVVGFKVLAGGAIHPEVGFQWAFDNGADFIEVGMFDFQIVANVNQTIMSYEKAKNRIRPWYG